MSWITGKQNRVPNELANVNEDILGLEGHLDEKKAKVWLYKFLRENITYATNLLMGVKLFPLQHIMIKTMLNTDYTLGIVSRGGSKSWASGVFAGLDAALNQGIRTGILAASFRQSKQIFLYLEDILQKPEASLFSGCVGKISKANDMWSMKIGDSEIVALPLGSGEKLRGFRFHRIIIDEALLMPEKILNEVIIPFLGVVENPVERQEIYDVETKLINMGEMREEDRKQWPNNKLIALSSASYKFEHLYKLYETYQNLILNPKAGDKATRAIIHLSHHVIPSEYFDKNLIKHAAETMSQSQFDREFGAIFTDDSSGFFKMSKMKACCIPEGTGQSVELSGDPSSKYILSLDPSWSESEGSDDFSMQVLKLEPETETYVLVHSYAMSGTRLKDHIFYFWYLLKNFNIEFIIGDYNGGVQFINAAIESGLFRDSGIEIHNIDLDFDNPNKYLETIAEFKKEFSANYKGDKKKYLCHLRKPTGNWIRLANESLQAAFDHKWIKFASRAYDNDFKHQIAKKIPISKLRFIPEHAETKSLDELNKGVQNKDGALMVDFVEHQGDMIDLTISECALIEVKSNPQGSQTFDLPLELRNRTGANKPRKDSYSALVLGNWGVRIYYDMLKEPEKVFETFMPTMI